MGPSFQSPADITARLRDSGLFDGAWYARIADLAHVPAADLIGHYVAHGLPSGRGPNAEVDRLLGAGDTPSPEREAEVVELIRRAPTFDAGFYLEHNPDVARAGADPQLHFHRHGWKEFRNPSAHFDTWWYCSVHLPQAGGMVDPLAHYLLLGRRLGLDPVPSVRPAGPGLVLAPGRVARVCLFAGYDPDGLVDDCVLRYVQELSRHA